MTLRLSRLLMAMSDSHLAGISRLSSCTSRVVGDSDKRPNTLTAHLPASCTSRQTGRKGTYIAGRFHCRNTLPPASCTTEWPAPYRPTHHKAIPSITQHTTSPISRTIGGEARADKEGGPPLCRSLSIERSERFPHCLLEIPLPTPGPKQTLRFANRTYSAHNNLRLSPMAPANLLFLCVCDS